MKQILLGCFDEVKKIIFQYGGHKLQKSGALTCGEHVIYFILFQSIFYIENRHFELNYVSKIAEYCHEHKITPDEFVSDEIYNNLELGKPPDLRQVLNWYENN